MFQQLHLNEASTIHIVLFGISVCNAKHRKRELDNAPLPATYNTKSGRKWMANIERHFFHSNRPAKNCCASELMSLGSTTPAVVNNQLNLVQKSSHGSREVCLSGIDS